MWRELGKVVFPRCARAFNLLDQLLHRFEALAHRERTTFPKALHVSPHRHTCGAIPEVAHGNVYKSFLHVLMCSKQVFLKIRSNIDIVIEVIFSSPKEMQHFGTA